MAKEHKLSVVRTYCGHGIGELFHTSPNVPHYAKNKAVGSSAKGKKAKKAKRAKKAP